MTANASSLRSQLFPGVPILFRPFGPPKDYPQVKKRKEMNTLNDLKQWLSILLIQYADEYGNYRSAADIYKDIGVVY